MFNFNASTSVPGGNFPRDSDLVLHISNDCWMGHWATSASLSFPALTDHYVTEVMYVRCGYEKAFVGLRQERTSGHHGYVHAAIL